MKTRLIVVLLIILMPLQIAAKPIEFLKDYSYDASEADSLLTCRTVSLMQVKRLLLEELGIYLESHTEIVNYQLEKDQITVLTAGIVKTEIVDEKWNGRTYWLKAKLEADPDEVVGSIDKLRKSNQIDSKVNELSEEYDSAFAKIQELKEQLADAQRNVVRLNQDYQDAQKFMSAANLLEKGNQLRKQNKPTAALKAYTQGIEMSPSYALYLERAKTYMKLKKFETAIRDLDGAIALKSEYGKAYFHKGIALGKKGNRRNGIKLIKKAAKMGNQTAKLWLKAKRIKY